jgi:Domain of unknown function (DUF4214)
VRPEGTEMFGLLPRILRIEPDTGWSSSDSVTRADSITVFGFAFPNQTVTLTLDGRAIGGPIMAETSGAWRASIDTRALAEGVHRLQADDGDASDGFAFTLDRTGPNVENVEGPADGTYGFGKLLSFTVKLSEPVSYIGSPTLTVLFDGRPVQLTNPTGNFTDTLTFLHATTLGDRADRIEIAKLDLDGVTSSSDVAGNPWTDVGFAPLLTGAHVAAAEAQITSITGPNGYYGPGSTVDLVVTYGEVVFVTGTPSLVLNLARGDMQRASYVSGDGTNQLVFRYIVQTNDGGDTGVALVTTIETANGASIRNGAGTDASHLPQNQRLGDVHVDGVPPRVIGLEVLNVNGPVKADQVLTFVIRFQEPVLLSGPTPSLGFVIGSTPVNATYLGGAGTSTLRFTYKVLATDRDSDGIDFTGLQLNGGTIRDAAGNDATTTLDFKPDFHWLLIDGPGIGSRGGETRNTVTGTPSDDTLTGAGSDIFVSSGVKFGQVAIAKQPDGTVVITGPQGSDTLRGFGYLKFDDGTVVLNAGEPEHGAQAWRLYQAAFNRIPDGNGLKVQVGALDAGVSLTDLAKNFLNSAEFVQRYGTSLSDSDFVNALYRNVLNRPADPGGLGVQLDALAHGMTRAELLRNFAESAENVALTGQYTRTGLFVFDTPTG